jgi:gliding motility-associated-like protein
MIPLSSNVDTWLWSDGSTDSTFSVSSAGVIHVLGSNQCGSGADTINVTLLPATPTLDLGNDLSICPGETITVAITIPDVDIEWVDGSTNTEFIVSDQGVVHATITNACGYSTDTINVDLLPDAPILDLGADQSLCPGETITLDPGIEDVAYLWHDGSQGMNFETTQPGTIILTISNSCGSSTDTVLIMEDTNGPQLDLGPDILSCEGNVVTLLAGISGVDYLWQDGSTSPQYDVTTSGTYHLQVSNACGSDADTVLVDIHGTIPNPSLGADTSLCEGEVLLLTSNADTETSILWQDQSTGMQFLITGQGTYILSEQNHCGSASDTIIVTYGNAPLPFNLGEDVVLCPGESILLNAPVTNDLTTWSDGSHGSSFIASEEQTYSLVISNDCGEVSDEINVSFDAQAPLVELGPAYALCPEQSITLDVTQPFAADYLWNTGSTLPSLTITNPDFYAVTVFTVCYSVSDDILIDMSEDCGHDFFIPNIFSPNGDQVNDEWVVMISDPNVTEAQCRVFDRWGDLVYETRELLIQWDGNFNGKAMNPGVYVAVIILERQDGTSQVMSSDVTLVR